jgi:hypothetical protein
MGELIMPKTNVVITITASNWPTLEDVIKLALGLEGIIKGNPGMKFDYRLESVGDED